MTRPEKKEFLTMDLVDRLIRVEQKVSAHFNKHLCYNDTDYYKNMSVCDRKKYEKFRRHKKIKKLLASLFIFSPIVILLLMNIDITARIIESNLNITDLNATQFIIWAEAMFFMIIAIYIVVRNRALENLEDSYLAVLEKMHLRRHLNKQGF